MRIAVVGDIHRCWSPADVEYFNSSDYDLVLLCGDLPGRTHHATLTVARLIAMLRKPAVMVPGNHDGTTPVQVAAELTRLGVLRRGLTGDMAFRVAKLAEALHPVVLGGYSRHHFEARAVALDVIVARPHAMDREVLSFGPYLEQAFGVATLEASKRRLEQLVDQSGDTLLFLAHNGVEGLGAAREDIWGGIPIRKNGDNGDVDLAHAVAYARDQGKAVIAVIAGHMHHQGDLGHRRWWLRREEVLYVNAARVPRVFKQGTSRVRHHVRIVTTGDHALVEEVLVSEVA